MNLDQSLRVSLVSGAELPDPEGEAMSVREIQVPLAGLPAAVRARLPDLMSGSCSLTELGTRVIDEGTAADNFAFHTFMARLQLQGILLRTLDDEEEPLLSLEPMSNRFVFRPDLDEANSAWQISRFALLRRDREQMVLESPTSCARLQLHGARGAALFAAFAKPCTAIELVKRGIVSNQDTAQFAIALLRCAETLVDPDDDAQNYDNPTSSEGWWEFPDMLFHTRSRLGRFDQAYGGTFHRKGHCPPPPLVKAPAAQTIVLQPPDLERIKQLDPPFTQVLEQRRSKRDYDERGPTLDELSEFLYRAARIQTVLTTPEGEMNYSYRPHPGGGAIHELEIYPIIANCEGLEPGVYHYNPRDHHLDVLAPPDVKSRRLLELAWHIADKRSRPQIYLGIAARFHRLQWKYESTVYATILKNVGVLYQTFYLVATAMNLAPVALGGGDSELFGEIAGLDYYQESLVGEFLVGRPQA